MSLRRTRRRSGHIELCLPTPAKQPPAVDGWLHEIKHDGSASWPGARARDEAAGVAASKVIRLPVPMSAFGGSR
jgi:hypothetical protein